METLDQVRQRPPQRPAQLNQQVPTGPGDDLPEVPGEGPARRYDSAAALADDLERFLRGEPILARRTGAVERVVKWARRHPMVATLVALLQVVALVGFLGILWQWRRAEDLRVRAEAASNFAIAAKNVADEGRRDAQRTSSRLALDRGLSLCQEGEVGQGMLWMARSLELASSEQTAMIRVTRLNLASWRNRLAPLRTILADPAKILTADFHPDGSILLVGGERPGGEAGEATLVGRCDAPADGSSTSPSGPGPGRSIQPRRQEVPDHLRRGGPCLGYGQTIPCWGSDTHP